MTYHVPELIIPVGIPGCGKSTFAQTFFKEVRDDVVSTDEIRAAMGDVTDQTQNDQVFDAFHAMIEDRLKSGRRVFADATNLTWKARFLLSVIAENTMADTHLLVFNNLAQAIKRNQSRERVVPDEAMTRMLSNYEKFRLDLPKEHMLYDSITQIGEF